jgi:hypothetical protein
MAHVGQGRRNSQIGRWQQRGVEALGASATEILLLIIDGHNSIAKLRRANGLSLSATGGHVRRLKGKGLVQWSLLRGDPITPLVGRVVELVDINKPIDLYPCEPPTIPPIEKPESGD